jgi:hypothetical protein
MTPLEDAGSTGLRLPEGSHVVLCVVRNEMLRLPYLLSYYRQAGFDRFLFVDNGSSDGSGAFLAQQPDCVVFATEGSFGASGGGAGLGWKHALLDRFCDGLWVATVDADEILVWPGSDRENNIKALTARCDALGSNAVIAMLLDMYSDKGFGEIGYVPGAPFVEYCPFFDRGPYQMVRTQSFPFREFFGGVRARAFRTAGVAFHPPTISKVPLVRWRSGQRYTRATHFLHAPMTLAPLRAALLHFKMFDDLPEKCRAESLRGEYYEQGREYDALAKAIALSPAGSFFDPVLSIRYAGPEQLVALRVMHPGIPYAGSAAHG